MSFTRMFEAFTRYSRIVVTGPQRSGTTICGKMISADTGYRYVDETEFKVSDFTLFQLLLRERQIVVQCPALCRHVHEIADDETVVVLMRRPVAEIVASQERIGWRDEPDELQRYGRFSGVIAEVKYDYWEKEQKSMIPHWYEIEFDSLAEHPLWVPAERRTTFSPRQTEI